MNERAGYIQIATNRTLSWIIHTLRALTTIVVNSNCIDQWREAFFRFFLVIVFLLELQLWIQRAKNLSKYHLWWFDSLNQIIKTSYHVFEKIIRVHNKTLWFCSVIVE